MCGQIKDNVNVQYDENAREESQSQNLVPSANPARAALARGPRLAILWKEQFRSGWNKLQYQYCNWYFVHTGTVVPVPVCTVQVL